MPHAETMIWRSLSTSSMRRERVKNLDALWLRSLGGVASARHRTGRYLALADRVVAREEEFATLAAARLRELVEDLRARFRLGRDTPGDLLTAFAAVREAAFRETGMRPFPAQVAGGLAMAERCLAEMATGEGKTLTATMPAVVAGWRGRGMHVVTVNDYLASRDAAWMGPVYRACGLTVACVTQDTPPLARREAYAADITYLTNKEAAADFLRDRLVLRPGEKLAGALVRQLSGEAGGPMGRLVMRGLASALVDEADSVLIDEAVTPLIIAGAAPNEEEAEAHRQAAALAAECESALHFRVDAAHREVRLTAEGKRLIAEAGERLGGVWTGRRRAEELLAQAVQARELFERGKQYVLQEGKVVIVDEFTGRLMPDRTWRDGLHQAVEAKEGLEVQPPKETLARVSFQRFFRLYKRLAGMTGTAREEAGELWMTYRLPVVAIPPNRPCRRVERPDRVFVLAEQKWDAAADEAAAAHALGQPVLIGVRTVEQSELLSGLLAQRGVAHDVLNAVRHAEEARIVASAGERGRVTIATNMAGRGTDIRITPEVASLGGLLVIATERHESRRVDRQLFGRTGRQGDPGEARSLVSLEDDLAARFVPRPVVAGLARAARRGEAPWRAAGPALELAQRKAQRIARRRRDAVLRADDWLDDNLGFAGAGV